MLLMMMMECRFQACEIRSIRMGACEREILMGKCQLGICLLTKGQWAKVIREYVIQEGYLLEEG